MIRRRVADVVATAQRVAAARPADPWPATAVEFSRELDTLVVDPTPDPAAVLGRRYEAGWRQHQAAPSFHFLQAMSVVADLHRCRWCDYDLRGSPGPCPECGRAADAATPPPSLRRLWTGVTLQLFGTAALAAGWVLVRTAPSRPAPVVIGLATLAAGAVG